VTSIFGRLINRRSTHYESGLLVNWVHRDLAMRGKLE
jgi:hypothetical protein